MGAGPGLFGILSSIRLRSDNIPPAAFAYDFVALVLGLLAGVDTGPTYIAPALTPLLVLVMYVADHPRLMPRARHQLVTLDAAIADETVLRRHLVSRLGIELRHCLVQELDFARDSVGHRLRTDALTPVMATISHLATLADRP